MNNEKLFIFFGATGNLFTEKIFPAFYHLIRRGKIDNFHILAIGRRFRDEQSYQSFLRQSLSNKIPNLDYSVLDRLFQKTDYYQGDVDDPQPLMSFLTEYHLISYQEVLFYLSTLPSIYTRVLRLIERINEHIPSNIPKKVIIEKPFGFDKKSFIYLNQLFSRLAPERNIFYVDHYLGKDTVQNIIVLKAENWFIENLLSAGYVKEIHIVVSEKEGVGSRGQFYEETGAIRDIFQNHLLQLLSLVAMDIPPLCQEDKIECSSFLNSMQQKKIEVIQNLKLPSAKQVFLGQYQSYAQEISNPFSKTETFIRLPLYISSKRWSGVPFWIITGKKLAQKISYIEIVFHSTTSNENRLIIEIQPEEKIDLVIQVKIPGMGLSSSPVHLNFNSLGTFGINSPEAYENILIDCYRGDKTLFSNSQFILHSWEIVDKLKELICKEQVQVEKYADNYYHAEEFINLKK
ncbi:MAG: hypothetical protein GX428_01525 [Candidatus Atribacteria bacterium]|nr:hypothetical protein [Candidatus Atribacteria bacterium]